MDKKTLTLFIASICCLSLGISLIIASFYIPTLSIRNILAGPHYEVHATIKVWKGNQLILNEYHAGNVTNLGLNLTMTKLSGNVGAYNQTTYPMNCTFISIGNRGALTKASTELPGEWNRTTATFEDPAYNSFNLTCTFYPDTGPYTADCIGVNYQTGIGNGALFCSDIFTEVTGIDDTFTINVEFKVSAA
jgi:hypothetical protein